MAIPTNTRLALAHYMCQYPLSTGNSAAPDYYDQYFTHPAVEGTTDHRVYGGFWRDRPIFRNPLGVTDWAQQDGMTEIRSAKAGGFDGFIFDIQSWTDSRYTHLINLYKASVRSEVASLSFKVAPMIDLSTAGPIALTAQQTADQLAILFAYSSSAKLDNGAYIWGTFYAEKWSVSYIQAVQAALTAKGLTHAYFPCFIATEPAGGTTNSYFTTYAPVAYAMGIWGDASPASLTSRTSVKVDAIHALNLPVLLSVRYEDSRPHLGVYDEALNSTLLRNNLNMAMTKPCEFVMGVTWNDQSEVTTFQPTPAHGTAVLDLTKPHLDAWRAGLTALPAAPTTDQAWLFHRNQPSTATPTYPAGTTDPSTIYTKRMALRSGSSAVTNLLEAVTYLSAPADITVTDAAGVAQAVYTAPAGLTVHTWPLANGSSKPKLTAARGGVQVFTTALTSPATVSSSPYVQDMQYYAASTPLVTGGVTPTPVAPPSSQVVVTRLLEMSADTSTNWASANPTLLNGEFAKETDTGKVKLGDGVTAWASLAYFGGGGTSAAGQLPWGRTGVYQQFPFNSTSTFLLVAGSTRYVPLRVPNAVSTTKLGAEITTAGDATSLLRYGLWADNGAGSPGALIQDFGTSVPSAVGALDSPTVAAVRLAAVGWYWLGITAQGTGIMPTVRVLFGLQALGEATSMVYSGGGLQSTGITGAHTANPAASLTSTGGSPKVGLYVSAVG